MADIESNININVDTSSALASIKQLQAQISAFHQNISKGGAAANAELAKMQQNLVNSINATGTFSAQIKNVATTTETFTTALEKNKLSMGQYFRFAGSQVVGFRKLFSTEFDTVEKVARERVKTLQTQYIKLGRDASGAMKAIAVRPLALDMNDLGTQTAIAAQKQQIFNQLIKQGSTNLLNFGKNTQWAGRQLMVGFTIPLGIAGAAAAREFMKLEEQALRFQRVYGEFSTPTSEIEAMTDSLRDLSVEFTKYGIAVAQTMELAADAAAMGKQGQELLDQVTEATRLAVLGGVEQQEALETTISLTSAFGVETEKLAGKIDFLNAVENQTVTSIEDLTIAIPKAGPVVQQLGGDVEDLAFFLTAMKEGGINASEGANALKSGLASLINPTGEAVNMLSSFGINLNAIVEGNAGNVKNIVLEFASALDTLDPLNRARVIEQMFGKFQFARMSTLFQNVIAEGSQAQRVLQLTNATTEELAVLSERELKRVEDSPMYKFKGAMEEFKASLAPVGEAFLKAVTPIIEFGTRILEKFNGMSDSAKNFVVIATTLIGGLGPIFLMTFGLIANGIANIIKGFASVTGFFQRLGSQSTVLGEQTEYMTMQQLEAAAVASSLNQVHQTLTQTFTSEAAAIRQLASAYTAAIAAQSRMPGGMTGRGIPPKKFAAGGLVPGSGNKDNVSALLTPGEFVLTKDIVKKYPGLIAGMVSGDIQAFALGGGVDFELSEEYAQDVGPRRRRNIPQQIAKLGELGLGSEAQDIVRQLQEAKVSNTAARQILGDAVKVAEQAARESTDAFNRFVQTFDATMDNWQQSASTNSKDLVAMMRSETGMTAPDRTGARSFAHIGSGASMTAEEYNRRFGSEGLSPMESRELEQLLATNPQKTVGIKSRLGMANFSQDVNAKLAREGADIQEFMDAFDVAGVTKWNKSIQDGGGNIDELADSAAQFDNVFRDLTSKVEQGTKIFDSRAQAELYMQRNAGRAATSVEELYAAARQSADPRLRSALDIAHQTAGEVRFEASRKKERNYPATVSSALNPVAAAEQVVTPAEAQAARNAGDAARRQINNEYINAMQSTADTNSDSKRTRKVAADTVNGYINKLGDGVDDAARMGQRTAAAYSQGTQMAPLIGEGPLLPGQERIDPRQKTPGRMAKLGKFLSPGRMAGAGFAVTGAVSMASMIPGKVGETAQKLIGPMMALSAILPLLTNKFGAIALLLAAIPAAIIALNVAFDNAQRSAIELTNALGGGEKSMREFAEFTGAVTAGEIMDKRRQEARAAIPIASGAGTFGESYIESEAGKALMDSVSKTMEKLGSTGAMEALGNKLAMGVISGALTNEQAESIAANIGLKLGDYDFGIGINAKLDEILGPNGEDLAKGPFEVSMKMSQESRKSLTNAFENIIGDAAEIKIRDVAMIGGGIAAGAGAGAAIGAGAGTAIMPGKGTAIGAVAGTLIGGVTGGITAAIERNNRIAEATGAVAALTQIALQQQQEMLDALDLHYEKQIEIAQAAGDLAQVEKLTNDRLRERTMLLEENKLFMQDLLNNFNQQSGEIQDKLIEGTKKSIEAQYKDTPLADVAKEASNSIADAALTKEQELLFTIKLSTGDIDPVTMINLLDTFKQGENLEKVANLVLNMESAQFDNFSYILDKIGDKDAQYRFLLQIDSMANNELVSADQINQYIDTLMQVQKLDSVISVEAALTFLVNNPLALDQLQDDLQMIENTPDITINAMANTFGQAELAAMNDQANIFNSLPETSQKSFLSNVTTIFKTIGTPAFQQQFASARAGGFKGNEQQYAVNQAMKIEADAVKKRNQQRMAQYNEDLAAFEQASASGGGGGGGGGSVQKVKTLDSLLSKLKQVQIATLKLTEGWNASRTSLDSLLNSGMMGFNGLEQQMRRLGAREDLITLIAGMDPAEFERRKNELFTFDGAGNITGFRQSLLAIGEAMRAIAMGEFQSKQQKTIQTINDQQIAIRKLTNAGMSYADAYQAVQDAAFASAIAMEKSNEAIRQSIKDANAAALATRNLAAAQALASKNAEAVDQGKLLDFLEQNAGKLTDAQTQAILADKNLQTLALSPNFDPNTFQDALNNAANQAQVDLRIKKLTIDGMEQIFQDGFSKAMDAFAAAEQSIKLKFNIDRKPFIDAIEAAQEQISDLQNAPGGLDDLDADLQRITFQEEQINERYQKRIDALDEVRSINERLIRQQKQQLTIADALSQGDIAAAARAVQEMREQNAQNAKENQQKRLETAREAELARVVGSAGLTREQIEKRVKDLKQQILEIEEQTIEPAEYQVELIDRLEKKQISQLTVLGKTKDEWELIKNNIDVARTNSDSYTKAIEGALEVVKDIETYWDNIDGKEVTVDLVIRQTGDITADNLAPISPAVPPAQEESTGSGGPSSGGPTAPEQPQLEEEFDVPGFGEGPAEPQPELAGWQKSLMAIYNVVTTILAPAFELIRRAWEGFVKYIEISFQIIYSILMSNPVTRAIIEIGTAIVNFVNQYLIQPLQAAIGWFFEDTSMMQKEADVKRWLGNLQIAFLNFGIRVLDALIPIAQGFDTIFGTSYAEELEGFKNDAIDNIGAIRNELALLPITGAEAMAKLGQDFRTFQQEATLGVDNIKLAIQGLPADTQAAILEEIPKNFDNMAEWAAMDVDKIKVAIKDLPVETQDAILNQLSDNFSRYTDLANAEVKTTEDAMNSMPANTQDAITRILGDNFGSFRQAAYDDITGLVQALNVMPDNTRQAIMQTLPENFRQMAVDAGIPISEIEKALKDIPVNAEGEIVTDIPALFGEAKTQSNYAIDDIEEKIKGLPGATSNAIKQDLPQNFKGASTKSVDNLAPVQGFFTGLPGRIGPSMDSTAGTVKSSFRGGIQTPLQGLTIKMPTNILGIPLPGFIAGKTFKPFASITGLNAGGIVPGVGNKDTEPAMLTPGEFVINKNMVQRYGVGLMEKINSGELDVDRINVPTFGIGQTSNLSSTAGDTSVYNNTYSINVNVKSDANPDQIARAVMTQIKQVDAQRIRGNRF